MVLWAIWVLNRPWRRDCFPLFSEEEITMKKISKQKWIATGLVGATLWNSIPIQAFGQAAETPVPAQNSTESVESENHHETAENSEDLGVDETLAEAAQTEAGLNQQEADARLNRCKVGQSQIRERAFGRLHRRLEEDRNSIFTRAVDNGYSVLSRSRDQFNRIQERLFASGVLQRQGETLVSRYSNALTQLTRLNRARNQLIARGEGKTERFAQVESRINGILGNLDGVFGVAIAPELHNGSGSTERMGQCPQPYVFHALSSDVHYQIQYRPLVTTLAADGSTQYAVMSMRAVNLASAARFMFSEANMAEPQHRFFNAAPQLACRTPDVNDEVLRPLHVQTTRLVWEEASAGLFALTCDFDRRYFNDDNGAQFVAQCAHMNLLTLERSDLSNIHSTLGYPGISDLQPTEFRTRDLEIAELRNSEFANCESLLYPAPPQILVPILQPMRGEVISAAPATLTAPSATPQQEVQPSASPAEPGSITSATATAPTQTEEPRPLITNQTPSGQPEITSGAQTTLSTELPVISTGAGQEQSSGSGHAAPATPVAPETPAPAPAVTTQAAPSTSDLPVVVVTQTPMPPQTPPSGGTVVITTFTPAPPVTTAVTASNTPPVIDCEALLAANSGSIPQFEPGVCVPFFDGVRAVRRAQAQAAEAARAAQESQRRAPARPSTRRRANPPSSPGRVVTPRTPAPHARPSRTARPSRVSTPSPVVAPRPQVVPPRAVNTTPSTSPAPTRGLVEDARQAVCIATGLVCR